MIKSNKLVERSNSPFLNSTPIMSVSNVSPASVQSGFSSSSRVGSLTNSPISLVESKVGGIGGRNSKSEMNSSPSPGRGIEQGHDVGRGTLNEEGKRKGKELLEPISTNDKKRRRNAHFNGLENEKNSWSKDFKEFPIPVDGGEREGLDREEDEEDAVGEILRNFSEEKDEEEEVEGGLWGGLVGELSLNS
jgi:hypothetical protein